MKVSSGLLFAFVLVLVVFGCRKKSATPTPIDSYAASFFTGYQPGTYWIYQDSSGLITDSEVVTYVHCGANPNNAKYEECYSFIYSDSVEDNENWSVTKYDTVTSAAIQFDADKPGLSEIYGIYFNNNNIDTTDIYGTLGLNVQKLNTYQVNQFAFNNALKISYSPPSVPYYMYIVIVPNIGVVERLVPDSGYVLKLKRYHIVS